MKPAKAQKVERLRQWLIDNDIEFAEHDNGYFRIFVNNEPFMDVWATTERFMLASNGRRGIGIHLIKKYITSAYGAQTAIESLSKHAESLDDDALANKQAEIDEG
jgi:hypothetical protein